MQTSPNWAHFLGCRDQGGGAPACLRRCGNAGVKAVGELRARELRLVRLVVARRVNNHDRACGIDQRVVFAKRFHEIDSVLVRHENRSLRHLACIDDAANVRHAGSITSILATLQTRSSVRSSAQPRNCHKIKHIKCYKKYSLNHPTLVYMYGL